MINPYVGVPRPYPVVAAILPTTGEYDIVFDTPAGKRPGRYTFRFWVDDTTPPAIRLLTRTVRTGEPGSRRRHRRRLRRRPEHGLRHASTAGPFASRSGTASRRSRWPARRPERTASSSPPPTTRSRRTWRTSARSSRTRARSGRPSSSAERASAGRSPRSSAAARGRAPRWRRSRRRRRGDDRERLLALLPFAAAARLRPDARLQPPAQAGPFRPDYHCDRQDEQGDVQPAHGTDLSEGE